MPVHMFANLSGCESLEARGGGGSSGSLIGEKFLSMIQIYDLKAQFEDKTE